MKKPSFQEVIEAEDLPSLPEVANRVINIARDDGADVELLAEAVRADPAISAKVLRTANSALFGRQYQVSSIKAAIPVLGSRLLRTLVLGFTLARQGTWKKFGTMYRKVWLRALRQAVAAERLSERDPDLNPSLSFVCGLLQDIGALAILRSAPEFYTDNILKESSLLDLALLEKKVLGFTHVEVSVSLCERWQFDAASIDAIQSHHEPITRSMSSTNANSKLVQTLKLAQFCAHFLETPDSKYSSDFSRSMEREFGIRRYDLPAFFDEINARVASVSNSFDSDIGCSFDELLGKAKRSIEDLAIKTQIEATRAQAEADLASQRLEKLESHKRALEDEIERDPLTGVGNRRALQSWLEEQIDVCNKEGLGLGILFFDLDNFKTLNDTLGHEAGDQALCSLVEVLQNSLRSNDLVVRYGGDEFVALCVNTSIEGLHKIADRICETFRGAYQSEVPVSTSIGGVHCGPERLRSVSPDDLLQLADQKMYVAKKLGGDQCCIVSIDAETTSPVVTVTHHNPPLHDPPLTDGCLPTAVD